MHRIRQSWVLSKWTSVINHVFAKVFLMVLCYSAEMKSVFMFLILLTQAKMKIPHSPVFLWACSCPRTAGNPWFWLHLLAKQVCLRDERAETTLFSSFMFSGEKMTLSCSLSPYTSCSSSAVHTKAPLASHKFFKPATGIPHEPSNWIT